MAWGKAREGRLDWAVGGFNGHLTGLADNNPNQEAVGYLNSRPFLLSERFPALRHLNVGASGSLGEFARNEAPLPLRTSVQAAENDEAANDASAVFLDFNEGAAYQGSRRFGAVHLAYYYRGLSFESEWNFGQFQMTRPGLANKPEIPVQGFHTAVAYFLTGEEVERRTTVVPLRPFRPLRGPMGPRRHRAVRPLQPAQPGRHPLHRRARRRPPLDQGRGDGRPRRQLVPQPLGQVLPRRGSTRCSAPRSSSTRRRTPSAGAPTCSGSAARSTSDKRGGTRVVTASGSSESGFRAQALVSRNSASPAYQRNFPRAPDSIWRTRSFEIPSSAPSCRSVSSRPRRSRTGRRAPAARARRADPAGAPRPPPAGPGRCCSPGSARCRRCPGDRRRRGRAVAEAAVLRIARTGGCGSPRWHRC